MNRLIINADDFGIHQEVNQAVAIGFDTGILRSTSLLASGPAFPEAVAVARQRPGLGIGIHLCLVGGLPPVLSPQEVPSLVDERGLFPDSYGEFMKRYIRAGSSIRSCIVSWMRKWRKSCPRGLPLPM